MRCTDCRKKEAEVTTVWERTKDWLLYKLFSEEVSDVKAQSFTQGFGDGYKMGWEHSKNFKNAYDEIAEKQIGKSTNQTPA